MYNMLIVEDEMIQSQFLINSIAKEIPEIRIHNIASTGLDAINIIKEQLVDIILLDLKLPDTTGVDIVDFISKNKIEKYKNSIIVVTAEMKLLSEIIGSPYIFTYNSKICGIDPIIENVRKIIEDKNENAKNSNLIQSINYELSKLNFNFTYIGTKYLAECIYQAYHQTNRYDINLNKTIYPVISKKYNKSINSIKTNINHATNNMYFDTEEKLLLKYFGYSITCKPRPKDIILEIIKNIEKRRS